ncbi:RPC7L polymerase, partial [Rynchops niger]|nr:RPC7L polymerase [Rynchops niger]
GRGRGRGRGQMTFNVEAVGIGKGDALPPPTLQPSPLFPVSPRGGPPSLVSLSGGVPSTGSQVWGGGTGQGTWGETGTCGGQLGGSRSSPSLCPTDWRRLPRELKIRVRRLQKGRTTILIPKCKQRVALDKEETIKKLESLEKKEEEVTSEEEEEKEEEEEGKEEEEEEYDEEEHEEETDYIMSYFDNGEDFGADSDDNMDEAVY